MDSLKQIISLFLTLIDLGGLVRMLYCFIRVMFNPDDAGSYLKKGKNLLIFMVLANVALVLAFVFKGYVS